MKSWLLPLLVLLPLPAEASYNLSAKCTLQHYVDKMWSDAQPSELLDRIEDPLISKNGYQLFKLRNRWYRVKDGCLTQNRVGAAASQRGIEHSRGGSSSSSHEWVFELSLGIKTLANETYQAHDVADGSLTGAFGAYSGKPNITLGASYRLREDLMIQYVFGRMTSTQIGNYTGSVTGTVQDDEEFYDFGAGILKHWGNGKFKPFAGAQLGYSLASGLYTYSGFTGPFAGINGGVDVAASGPFVALHAGVDWWVSDQISIFPDVGIEKVFYGHGSVHATTSSLYHADQVLPSIADTRITLSLGARYWL